MRPEKAMSGGSVRRREQRFNYADYLELRGWEFEKFREMPPLTEEEIVAVDWDGLFARLLAPFGHGS